MAVIDTLRRWAAALQTVDADITELSERRALLDRPWEEDLLHWSFDGQGWELHGRLAPPPGGRRRVSVTRRGWCPGLAAKAHRPPAS